MTSIRVVDDERRPFFTPKALAAYFGISERTLRDMATRREIASYRVGGRRRFSAEDVDRYLARHRDEQR